jgi:hypothetical protein
MAEHGNSYQENRARPAVKSRRPPRERANSIHSSSSEDSSYNDSTESYISEKSSAPKSSASNVRKGVANKRIIPGAKAEVGVTIPRPRPNMNLSAAVYVDDVHFNMGVTLPRPGLIRGQTKSFPVELPPPQPDQKFDEFVQYQKELQIEQQREDEEQRLIKEQELFEQQQLHNYEQDQYTQQQYSQHQYVPGPHQGQRVSPMNNGQSRMSPNGQYQNMQHQMKRNSQQSFGNSSRDQYQDFNLSNAIVSPNEAQYEMTAKEKIIPRRSTASKFGWCCGIFFIFLLIGVVVGFFFFPRQPDMEVTDIKPVEGTKTVIGPFTLNEFFVEIDLTLFLQVTNINRYHLKIESFKLDVIYFNKGIRNGKCN